MRLVLTTAQANLLRDAIAYYLFVSDLSGLPGEGDVYLRSQQKKSLAAILNKLPA